MVLARRVFLTTPIALAATSGAFTGLLACGDEANKTSGRRIALEVRTRAAALGGFENALGFRFELAQAELAIAGLAFFDGPPIFARLGLGLRRAWAHPGHYVPGTARGELPSAARIDLVAGPGKIGIGAGVTGAYRSARVLFDTREATIARVAGRATKAGRTVEFRVALGPEDLAGTPAIDGCPFATVDVDRDGVVTMEVHPEVWLDQIDLGAFPSGQLVDLVGTTEQAAFARGVRKASAYRFAFETTR
jgi:hypothetical protein